MPPSKKKTGPRRRRAPARRTRVPRLIKDSQYANIQETYNVGLINANNAGRLTVAGLSGFVRAQNIARQFQLYRISHIELNCKPLYDTFIPGAVPVVGPATVPQFYYSIVRDGDFPSNATNVYFERRGCKPIRFDDKPIIVKWKPNVTLQVGQAGTQQPRVGNMKMTPWLSCDRTQGIDWTPDDTYHYGICFAAFTSLVNPAGDNPIMQVTMTVHYQFKKPHQQLDSSGPLVRDLTPTGYIELFDASGNSLDKPSAN